MNPSDSKKLEEIERLYNGFWEMTAEQERKIGWLISKVKEQDREIERLREAIPDVVVTYGTEETVGINDVMRLRAEKAEAELAKWTKKHDNVDLQALREQAENSHSLAAHAAYIHGLEVHLRQAEARTKELEQELLWAADACEKSEAELVRLREDTWFKRTQSAEAELVQLRKYNDVLQSQRAAVYNEGVEDGKRQAEKEKGK